jgi:hypothetical protein
MLFRIISLLSLFLQEHHDDPQSSWGFFKIFGVIIVVIIAIALVGLAIYMVIQRQSHNKKRFY